MKFEEVGKPKFDMIHPGKSSISYTFPHHSFSFLLAEKKPVMPGIPHFPMVLPTCFRFQNKKGNIPAFFF